VCRALHLPSLANVASCPPAFRGATRLSKAQRAGLAFQKKLFLALAAIAPPNAECQTNSWFSFRDRNGPGCASPDIFVRPLADGSILLVEAKLKLSAAALDEGLKQLLSLYSPLFQTIFPESALRLLLVGRYLSPASAGSVPLTELVGRDLGSVPTVAFWPGTGRIQPALLAP
jgi:hypothetical protein